MDKESIIRYARKKLVTPGTWSDPAVQAQYDPKRFPFRWHDNMDKPVSQYQPDDGRYVPLSEFAKVPYVGHYVVHSPSMIISHDYGKTHAVQAGDPQRNLVPAINVTSLRLGLAPSLADSDYPAHRDLAIVRVPFTHHISHENKQHWDMSTGSEHVDDRTGGELFSGNHPEEDSPFHEVRNTVAGQRAVRSAIGIPEGTHNYGNVYFRNLADAESAAQATGGQVHSVALMRTRRPLDVPYTSSDAFIHDARTGNPSGADSRRPAIHLYDHQGSDVLVVHGQNQSSALDRYMPHFTMGMSGLERNAWREEFFNSPGVRKKVRPDPNRATDHARFNADYWRTLIPLADTMRREHPDNPDHPLVPLLGKRGPLRDQTHLLPPSESVIRSTPVGSELYDHARKNPQDHTARLVLADHLRDQGHDDAAGFFDSTMPRDAKGKVQLSRKGEIIRYAREKLRYAAGRRSASVPMSADSLGSSSHMRMAGVGEHYQSTPHSQPFRKPLNPETPNEFGLESVPDVDSVRNSPHTLHFVAHHPAQLTPLDYTPSRHDDPATPSDMAYLKMDPSNGSAVGNTAYDMSEGGEGAELAHQVQDAAWHGQRRVRQLMGLTGDLEHRHPAVFFKSHRAAQLMAQATGGHVETIAFNPRMLAQSVAAASKNLAGTGRYRAGNDHFGNVFDQRNGMNSGPEFDELMSRASQHSKGSMRSPGQIGAPYTPTVIRNHPVLGEYITQVGAGVNPFKGGLSNFADTENPHRGMMLQERDWQPDEEVARSYGHPPQHDHISQLGQTAQQLHQQFLAKPDDHLNKMVLADHLEDQGHHDLANLFRSSVPQQFSRKGQIIRYARKKLAAPAQPAEPFAYPPDIREWHDDYVFPRHMGVPNIFQRMNIRHFFPPMTPLPPGLSEEYVWSGHNAPGAASVPGEPHPQPPRLMMPNRLFQSVVANHRVYGRSPEKNLRDWSGLNRHHWQDLIEHASSVPPEAVPNGQHPHADILMGSTMRNYPQMLAPTLAKITAAPHGKELYDHAVANPNDHSIRLVLADHLEENGDQNSAEFFRSTIPPAPKSPKASLSRHGEIIRYAREKLRYSAEETPPASPTPAEPQPSRITWTDPGYKTPIRKYFNTAGYATMEHPWERSEEYKAKVVPMSQEAFGQMPHVVHAVSYLNPSVRDHTNSPRNGVFTPIDSTNPAQQENLHKIIGTGSLAATHTVLLKDYNAALNLAQQTGGHVDTHAIHPEAWAKFSGGIVDNRNPSDQPRLGSLTIRHSDEHGDYVLMNNLHAARPPRNYRPQSILGDTHYELMQRRLMSATLQRQLAEQRESYIRSGPSWRTYPVQWVGDVPVRPRAMRGESPQMKQRRRSELHGMFRQFVSDYWPRLVAEHSDGYGPSDALHPHQRLFNHYGDMRLPDQYSSPTLAEIRAVDNGEELYRAALANRRDPAPRMMLSDLLEESGNNNAANFFRNTLPRGADGQLRYAKGDSKSAFMGINIRDSDDEPFTDWILDGKKTVETRGSNSLHPYLGRRVGIIRTRKKYDSDGRPLDSQAHLVGFATIHHEPVEYKTAEDFRADEDRHQVAEGSDYDWNGHKWGYALKGVSRLKTPRPVGKGGIVARKLNYERAGVMPIRYNRNPFEVVAKPRNDGLFRSIANRVGAFFSPMSAALRQERGNAAAAQASTMLQSSAAAPPQSPTPGITAPGGADNPAVVDALFAHPSVREQVRRNKNYTQQTRSRKVVPLMTAEQSGQQNSFCSQAGRDLASCKDDGRHGPA
jgi:uncharacterized protein (TIGR02996 family)